MTFRETGRESRLGATDTVPTTILAEEAEEPTTAALIEEEAAELKPVLQASARIRRLEREIVRLHESLGDKRRSAATKANYAKWIAANREAIQKVVAGMPLKPALIDDLVAKIRRHCERITRLAEEARRGRAASAPRELRVLEREAGLPRRALQA